MIRMLFNMELFLRSSSKSRNRFVFVFLLFLMQAKRFTFFQEVDMIPFAFVITPTLMLLMDFTIPLTVEDYHLLQPYPKEESHLTACLRPFSFTVQYMNSYSILDLITFNWQAINWLIIYVGLVTISPVNRYSDCVHGPIDSLLSTTE